MRQVNVELVTLNYQIGQTVFERVANGIWGEKTVDELADLIKSKMPDKKILQAKIEEFAQILESEHIYPKNSAKSPA